MITKEYLKRTMPRIIYQQIPNTETKIAFTMQTNCLMIFKEFRWCCLFINIAGADFCAMNDASTELQKIDEQF